MIWQVFGNFLFYTYICVFFIADIYPVMLDDDARYQCQVGPGPQGLTTFFMLIKFPLPKKLYIQIYVYKFISGQPGIRSRFATITILVPPEPPRILQGDHLVTTEDREIELECVSAGGKPAAEVI